MGGFSGDLQRGLNDFWSVYDGCYAEMQVALAGPLEDHAKFGPLMAKQSKQQRDAESAQSRKRLAKAIETNDWADYEMQLRKQGAFYANLGIGFRDWYDIIRLVAGYMVPKLTAAFLAEPDRLVAALQAQGEFFDHAMAVIGEAYIERSEARLSASVAAARDVTVQKRASQYARSLIEASLDPLVTISPEGKITDVNEGSIKVTGVPREKLVGTDFSDYFTEPEKAREGYQQVFAKGFVTDYPLTIRHKDGRLTDVLYNASVYKDAAGNVLGVFAAARDVTVQKRVEAELAEQRTRELERLAELERFQTLTVGRELRMIELKKEVEDLRKMIPSGKVSP
jgi:PAS domain S-box-containing protein